MNYLKKHWFEIVVGLISCGLAIYCFCTANIDTAILWHISACVWFGISRVDYNHERINLLEARAAKSDALAKKVDALEELLRTQDKLNQQKFNLMEERLHE